MIDVTKNRLIHGDCLEVMKHIPDNSIDLIVTDIPYGENYKSNLQTGNRRSGEHKIVRNENYFDEIDGDYEIPISWLDEAHRTLKINSAIYIFIRWSGWVELYNAVEKDFNVKNMIVLNKSNHGMGDLKGSYAPKHELILFAVKSRHILNFPNGREKDVWDVKVKYSGSYHYHPNEKPLEWMLPAIINSSNENEIVLDPFCGSSSTLIACLETNRKFIGIEIDKKYYDIAKERIDKWYNDNITQK